MVIVSAFFLIRAANASLWRSGPDELCVVYPDVLAVVCGSSSAVESALLYTMCILYANNRK